MSRNITLEEFQLVYDLVFPLHPRKEVALRVTMDACDFLRELERSQARRRRSARHWKADMTQEQLLQYAAYTVSYYRELDQESPRPLLPPFYQPTREDRIVRYVKHLIWRTYLLNARSIAIGIGCLLYAYKPSEIADLLYLFEERGLRTIKMRLAEDLRERFANDDVVSPDGKSMRIIPASDNDRLIIEGALKAFTPWGTDHLEPPTRDRLMLDMLWDEENPVSDWQRKHALIDPECAGLARLINEYNKFFSSNPISQRLADPRGNLMLPDFGGGPDPSLERFKQKLLSDSDKMFLNERRKPSGPWAYLAEVLCLQSEFVPVEDCLTDFPIPINFCPTTVIHYMQYQNRESQCGNKVLNTSEQIPAKVSDVFNSQDSGASIVFRGRAGIRCLPLLPITSPISGDPPPLDSGDAEPQYRTLPPWIMFWRNVYADDGHNIESEPPRLFEVFEELVFPMTGSPPNRVSRQNFAFDVDIGSTVDPTGSFPNEKQAQHNYGKSLVFDMGWSSGTSATIHARLLELNQLLLRINYLTGRSSAGPNFFHFGGHGFESPPELSCCFLSRHGEQGFLRKIEGAICVWEAKYKRNNVQHHQPDQDVMEQNAEMESPNIYDKTDTPFINQPRPTQPFTFQGL